MRPQLRLDSRGSQNASGVDPPACAPTTGMNVNPHPNQRTLPQIVGTAVDCSERLSWNFWEYWKF